MAHTTRRTVIAGIAAAATPLPALAVAAPHDPIFAAIAAHTAATMHMLQVGKDSGAGDMLPTDPRHAAAEAAQWAADDAFDAETERLLAVKPTTMAGVVALLAHVVRFDTGQFTLGGTHRTEATIWPTHLIDDAITDGHGRPCELPFAHWVLHTVHQALTMPVA
jgi:hypothetical protein